MFYVVFLFVLLSSFIIAKSNTEDVIYLKNGGIFRGKIVEQIPNKTIKIETADRNVFVFPMNEIDKFDKEEIQSKNEMSLPKGYRGIVEVGYQFGVGEFGYDRLKLNLILAYQIHPYISIELAPD